MRSDGGARGAAPLPPDGADIGLGAYVSHLHATWLDREPERRWATIDGSLVFADISGFTPLAERLARHGKVGAEELTDTLNTVFAEFLQVAGRFGGDCLKFGGDALLLLFTENGHERRAAAAAHAMGDALRSLRRQRTSAGLAKLGISMGVHSGTVHAFLVGSTHRELVLAGPAVSRTLELEGTATAGQILVDDATAAELDLEDVEEIDGGELLLVRGPTAGVHERDGTPPTSAALGVPEALRTHLTGRREDGVHRLASVGFLQFRGTDAILRERGPRALADALETLVGSVQRSCTDHGVTFLATDVDGDGGKVILATGMPSSSADDEDRLLLGLRDALDATRGSPLMLRAGVNRGRIFAVDLGGERRRAFTVMGDAVNLAARVMGRGGRSELVATDEILESRRTDFELEALEPFMVKGKTEPINAQLVGAVRGSRLDDADLETPLVGRQPELDLIMRSIRGAQQGTGAIVELIGEAGIGKSKLVRTITELDQDLAHFAFEAGRYSLATPYFALRRGLRSAMGMTLTTPADEVGEALRNLVSTTAPELAPWLPLLGIPLGLEIPDTAETARLDPAHRQSTLQTAVTDLMTKLLDGPTLITIEDSHWLDGASCELLRALLAGVSTRPWAVLVTRREVTGGLDLTEHPHVETRRLEPLTRDDLLELGREVAGDAVLAPGVLDALVDRSGGNPLFLQELVRASASGAMDELPETVEALVAARIDVLDGADRALLRRAAVLGGHVPLNVLAAMMDEPVERVAEHVGRVPHYLVADPNGTLRFRHILLRDVAYEGLSFRARKALHERAAETFQRSTDDADAMAELLSIHFHRAGRYEQSWHYSRLAGERSQRNGAPVEAAAFYASALEASRRLEHVSTVEQAEVAERLGDTWELGGRYDQASRSYRQARRLAGDDPLRQAGLCRKIGYVRDHEGRYAAAQRWFSRGLAELGDDGDPAVVGGTWAELTTAAVSSRIRQGRHAKAVPQIEAAISHAESGDAPAALARALVVYDQLLVDQGRYVDARHSERAVRIYEDLEDHRGAAAAYNEMGSTAYWLGNWDEAVACWERAIESDQRAGALVNHAIYLNNIGEVRSDQGRWDEAEALLETAHELWTSGGWRIGSAWAMSNLGRVAARAGRFEVADERLRRAAELLSEIGAETMLLENDAREMERLVFAGIPGEALAAVDDLQARAQRQALAGVADFVKRLAGIAHCQTGDVARGLGLVRESIEANRAREAAFEVALGLEVVVRAGALQGVEALEEAAELERTFGSQGVIRTPAYPLQPSSR